MSDNIKKAQDLLDLISEDQAKPMEIHKRCFSAIWKWTVEPFLRIFAPWEIDFRSTPEYRSAREKFESTHLVDTVDHSVALNHAREACIRNIRGIQGIESKAAGLFVFNVSAIAVIYVICKLGEPASRDLLWATAPLIVSTILCLKVRQTQCTPQPEMDTDAILTDAVSLNSKFKSTHRLAAAFHCTYSAMQPLTNFKADNFNSASRAVVQAIIALVLIVSVSGM